jgi:hypothetical protein
MPERTDLLGKVQVAAPCSAAWDGMEGDERVRFCAHCRKNVYNLSHMRREEAETLVRESEGRLCVRFYRRRDGTLLTDNCPVGVRTARRWLAAQVAGTAGAFGIFAALAALAPLASAARLRESETFQRVRYSRLAQVEPFRSWFDRIDPSVVVGEMEMPSIPSPPTE